jgi:multidrug efflux pump subunit AcrA (membrane-fusion protein)
MNPGVRRQFIALLFLAVLAAGGAWLGGCFKAGENRGAAAVGETVYTCGMHPQVIQDHPGECPICGMKLTAVRKRSAAVTAGGNQGAGRGKDQMAMDLARAPGAEVAAAGRGTMAIDSVTIQNMGIRTATVRRGPLRRTLRATGVIEYNQRTLGEVTTRFEGWIEKLYVNALGEPVTRGDPVLEIYSPQLYSAQAEYLLAIEAGGKTTPPGEATRSRALVRLKSFDMTDEQIAELERTRQPRRTLPVLAPRDGVVIELEAVEGQRAERGMMICRLGDLGSVWVRADVPEADLVFVQRGQEATLTLSYLRDRGFRGRVTYIHPGIDERTGAARLRLEFQNPGFFLKPGMVAAVRVACELEPSALLVPDMAILRGGGTTTVFVALAGGRFEPRAVTLGPRADQDEYQVLEGVSEGERIVTSGQFLLDSESQFREAVQKMMGPGQGAALAGSPRAVAASAAGAVPAVPAAAPEAAKYICPVPEHVAIEYARPGVCAVCGTALVRVSEATLKKVQPGGEVIYYTCPMPEDSGVRSETPGRCPNCGLTLIPVMEAPPITEAGGDGAHGGHNH